MTYEEAFVGNSITSEWEIFHVECFVYLLFSEIIHTNGQVSQRSKVEKLTMHFV